MATRIAEVCRATGQPVPGSPAEVTRVILDSLALAWRRTITTIERVAGIEAEVIHLVGGGAENSLLVELCASACDRPVVVGPAEASVVGNALVQAVADGAVNNVADGRLMVARATRSVVVQPGPGPDWTALARRIPVDEVAT